LHDDAPPIRAAGGFRYAPKCRMLANEFAARELSRFRRSEAL
jgi:hypothetical protein